VEPRSFSWRQRTLDVRLVRAARTDWGLTPLSSSGELLDERPVVPRVERIKTAIYVDRAEKPTSVIEVGNKKPPSS
jgi:hypothetical protein